MSTRIEMEKVDYSSHADILKELYSGGRQVMEARWDDFLKIPVSEGYQANTTRVMDFSRAQTHDICGNTITVTIVEEDGVDEPTNLKWFTVY